MKKKTIAILLIVLAVAGIVIYRPIKTYFVMRYVDTHSFAMPMLLTSQLRDPKIAKEYNTKGYIDISLPSDSPLKDYSLPKPKKGVYLLKKGEKLTIPLLLTFVSYDPTVTEAHVKFDPKDMSGGQVEVYYPIRDKNGNVKGTDKVNINDYISFNKKSATIKAGETVVVVMTLSIPKDFPNDVQPFTLNPYGIICEDTNVVLILNDSELAPSFSICTF